ncbi:hypothetical protein FOZ61_010637 [Perkinsus olseni]|uniref:Intraflagellar transport protein 88 n=1 Tax=Perkinsus olseni TaxID=32597 RepID=A0A7J6KVK8_PEROL|nr:hypothetical protein FOZ61_010637 [Perkinsus olseni]
MASASAAIPDPGLYNNNNMNHHRGSIQQRDGGIITENDDGVPHNHHHHDNGQTVTTTTSSSFNKYDFPIERRDTYSESTPLKDDGLTVEGGLILSSNDGRITSSYHQQQNITRPVTSTRAAGYTHANNTSFDPFRLQRHDNTITATAAAAAAGGNNNNHVRSSVEDDDDRKIRNMEHRLQAVIDATFMKRVNYDNNGVPRLSTMKDKKNSNTTTNNMTALLRDNLDELKEAQKVDKQILKLRAQTGRQDDTDLDLTYLLQLTIASHKDKAGYYKEAIDSYTQVVVVITIIASRLYPHLGRFNINIGDIYYKMGRYTTAIKMYRKALDETPTWLPSRRYKIRRNIGHAFYAMRQYKDAAKQYSELLIPTQHSKQDTQRQHHTADHGSSMMMIASAPPYGSYSDNSMDGRPPPPAASSTTSLDTFMDHETGLFLLLCYYAMRDEEEMRTTFKRLLLVTRGRGDPTLYDDTIDDYDDDDPVSSSYYHDDRSRRDDDLVVMSGEGGGMLLEKRTDEDPLREFVKNRRQEARNIILTAANLIAPILGIANNNNSNNNNHHTRSSSPNGYDWVIDTLYKGGYPSIAAEMEINKAHYYLKHKLFDEAITTLKSFENKDQHLMQTRAATNLSFIYFQEGDYDQAEKYADMAIRIDRYNCEALVNKGNCLFIANNLSKAKELYLEAIGVAAHCLEAIYNLGLVSKNACAYDEALVAFNKLHQITKSNCDVLWQLGDIYEKMGDHAKAHEHFSLILTQARGRPNDPTVLARIGQLYELEGNEVEAYHNYKESYRHWPLDLNVITWLGVYYVKKDLFESAVPLFMRASEISPSEPKWMLMVASCYRRMGDQLKAFSMYQQIHDRFPRDVESLKYLVSICKEMGKPCEQYENILHRLQQQQQQPTGNKQKQEGGGVERTEGISSVGAAAAMDSRTLLLSSSPIGDVKPTYEAVVADKIELHHDGRRRLSAGGLPPPSDEWEDDELPDLGT